MTDIELLRPLSHIGTNTINTASNKRLQSTPDCIDIAKRHSRMAVPFFVCLSFLAKWRAADCRPYLVDIAPTIP